MDVYIGLDVSLASTAVCVLDEKGKVATEAQVASTPEALVSFMAKLPHEIAAIGLEAGPLSHWLHKGMTDAGFEAVLMETRQVKGALKAMPIKTDRRDAEDHVWSYDFVHHQTYDGRAFRMLNVLDEFTRESLAIRVRRKLSSTDVIDVLTDLFILRGIPAYIRSDNGPEFVAEAVRRWIAAVGARTAFIEPGSPWENGYIESFNARLRDEFLNGEIFYTLKEARVLIESWRRHYNAVRPHSSLGYRPPAPETIIPPSWPPGSATLRRPSSLAEKPAMH